MEIVIVCFLGIWLVVASVLSYLQLKRIFLLFLTRRKIRNEYLFFRNVFFDVCLHYNWDGCEQTGEKCG